MMFTTALVSLLLTAVITRGQECPPTADDSVLKLEPESDAVNKGYSAIQKEAELEMRRQGGLAAGVLSQRTSTCPQPAHTDTINARVGSPLSSATALPWGRTCEACPPKEYHLRRFLRYCYVAFPSRQWLRFVRCPSRCNQPCWCSNSRCVATRHSLVWVWAYCTRNSGFGFVQGINYRWLWLPQDCQCRERNILG